jgi:hypothetical protein
LSSDIADVTTGAQSRHQFIIMVPATTVTYECLHMPMILYKLTHLGTNYMEC